MDGPTVVEFVGGPLDGERRVAWGIGPVYRAVAPGPAGDVWATPDGSVPFVREPVTLLTYRVDGEVIPGVLRYRFAP